MSEKKLREWVRLVMGKDVSWREPAFGASMGQPDADFNIDGVIFPVELKWWEFTKKGLKKKMRPVQIRYHIMSAMRGKKTAIMFGTDKGNDNFEVGFIAGKNCPKSPYEDVVAYYLWVKRFRDDDYVQSKNEVAMMLTSKEFWQ